MDSRQEEKDAWWNKIISIKIEYINHQISVRTIEKPEKSLGSSAVMG